MWVRWVCTVRGETKSLVSMFFLASTSRTDPSIVFATPQPRLHSRRRTVFKRDHLVRGSIGFAVAADRAGQIGEARERGEMPTGAQPLLRGRRHETPAGLPACIQGPVIVADPGACPKRRITICSESSAGLRRSCRRARRGPSSEDERVASTPLQERSFDLSAGPSVPTGRYHPVFLTWWACGGVAGQLRKSVKRPGRLGLSFPLLSLAVRWPCYGFPPGHPARGPITNAQDQHRDTSWTVGQSC